MKHVSFALEDKEHEQVEQAKGEMSWRDWVVAQAQEAGP